MKLLLLPFLTAAALAAPLDNGAATSVVAIAGAGNSDQTALLPQVPHRTSDCGYWREKTCRDFCPGSFVGVERCPSSRYKYTRCVCAE